MIPDQAIVSSGRLGLMQIAEVAFEALGCLSRVFIPWQEISKNRWIAFENCYLISPLQRSYQPPPPPPPPPPPENPPPPEPDDEPGGVDADAMAEENEPLKLSPR